MKLTQEQKNEIKTEYLDKGKLPIMWARDNSISLKNGLLKSINEQIKDEFGEDVLQNVIVTNFEKRFEDRLKTLLKRSANFLTKAKALPKIKKIVKEFEDEV